MSDTIIINTNPSASETLVINTSTKAPESINVNKLGYVLSVNGKIGVVILDKNDIGLGNVDNTSDLDKPISNETLSALFLKTDLGLFLSLNSFITSNSGNWDSVYFTVNELSGNWNSVYSYVNQTSANEFNQQAVTTFILANSSNITQVNSLVNSNSSNWNIAYNSSTIYQSNSSTYATINFSNNKFLPLSGGNISGTLNVQTKLLSAGTDLFDIFLTSETDSQTLFYNITSEDLTIVRGNTVNLSALSYRNIENQASTIEEFANSYSGSIFQGYTVTLYNERVYAFAGTDKNNPNHYLEVNSNPYKPIYREVSLSGNEIVLDTFYLGDFKSAKYNLQIETNFNNDIYYSEVNVIGSVQTSIGTACEYGVIFTDQLIMGYDANVSINNLNLILYYNYDPTPDRKLIIKGHRTNFYKI